MIPAARTRDRSVSRTNQGSTRSTTEESFDGSVSRLFPLRVRYQCVSSLLLESPIDPLQTTPLASETDGPKTLQTAAPSHHVVPSAYVPLQPPVSSSRQSLWRECCSSSVAGPASR